MKPESKRRSFLLGTTAGSAAAVAAAIAGGKVKQAAEAVQSVLPETQTGYRETDHIRQYYDTTRI